LKDEINHHPEDLQGLLDDLKAFKERYY
jgi:hypothetical protein